MEKHEKLTLMLIGRNSWSRPVYEGSDGSLYVDTDPCTDRPPKNLHQAPQRLRRRTGHARP